MIDDIVGLHHHLPTTGTKYFGSIYINAWVVKLIKNFFASECFYTYW